MKDKNVKPHLRWMIRRDMSAVMEIERLSFDHPWSDDDMVGALRCRNVIGMVALIDEQVAGYMVYAIEDSLLLDLMNLAVAPHIRRRGIGRALIAKLVGKLTGGRKRIVTEVSERNLEAQLWLRALGFRATQLRPDFWPHEDALRFEYRSSGKYEFMWTPRAMGLYP